MKKYFYLFIVASLFWCCSKNQDDDGIPFCEQPPNVIYDNLTFNLLKEDYQYPIIGGNTSIYNNEEIKLYDDNNDLNPTFDVNCCFTAVFFPKDSIAFEEVVTRNFFLQLDSIDTDTITFDFKLRYIEECEVVQFDFIEISYNDSLYYSNDRGGYPFLAFFKL